MELPDKPTPAMLDALGVMNFRTGPVAHALRADGQDIPTKCEAEQAHVLFWFLKLAIQHGDAWREKVGDELQAIAARKAPAIERTKEAIRKETGIKGLD